MCRPVISCTLVGGTLFAVPFDLAKLAATAGAGADHRRRASRDRASRRRGPLRILRIRALSCMCLVRFRWRQQRSDAVRSQGRRGGAHASSGSHTCIRASLLTASGSYSKRRQERNQRLHFRVVGRELGQTADLRREQPLSDLVRRRAARGVPVGSRRRSLPSSGSRPTAASPSDSRHLNQVRPMCRSRGLPTGDTLLFSVKKGSECVALDAFNARSEDDTVRRRPVDRRSRPMRCFHLTVDGWRIR